MDYQNFVLSKSSINFPQSLNRENIYFHQLPQPLTYFVLPEAKNLKIEKVNYSNKKEGFYIQYDVKIPFYDLYKKFQAICRRPDWKIIQAIRTNMFALRELEIDSYKLRQTQSLIDNNTTMVVIEILKNHEQ